MAQRIIIQLEDDLDGSEAAETIPFAIDGRAYEIDLNADNAGELRSALGRYVDAGRISDKGRENTKPATKRSESNAKEIRAWAHKNGISVNGRGRINEDVVKQYSAAH